ncbi:hypothetical protein DITRI_Ditri01bG0040000 [Diplodiscus trichospermus]
MWIFGWKEPSGFSASSTAEEVTQGIDGTGLTAIFTGASSGIGVETTRVLALCGVHVVMAVRNVDAGRTVKEAILKEIPGANIDVMELDLSSMESVRKFASEYQSLSLPLNLLMGYGNSFHAIPRQHRTAVCDKLFRSFSLNTPFVGDYEKYCKTMKNTARKGNREGRVVILSSEGHRFAYREGIRFDKINDESGYNSWFAYGQSKLANILHAKELAKHLKEEGVEITANSLHPGSIRTNLIRHHGIINSIGNMFGRFFLKSIPQIGAATTCYVALHPQVKGVRGEYFWDSNIGKPSSKANDAVLAKRLGNSA